MKTIKEMMAVMQAYADGKEIEFKSRGSTEFWHKSADPRWNWNYYDYRVKEESKYRPYANAEECFKDVIKHGGWIKCKGEYFHICSVCNECVFELAGCTVISEVYPVMFDNNVWADDESPCGVLMEE